MTSGDRARKALASFRLEGELVHREGGYVGVRRGGSLFEVAEGDVVELRELEDNRVQVSVNVEAQLTRTTLINARWQGSAVGYRAIIDDCSDITPFSGGVIDCECVYECSHLPPTECSNLPPTECSYLNECVWECFEMEYDDRGLSRRFGSASSWTRRAYAPPGRVRMLRRSGKRRS
jgi:hypothetical protein